MLFKFGLGLLKTASFLSSRGIAWNTTEGRAVYGSELRTMCKFPASLSHLNLQCFLDSLTCRKRELEDDDPSRLILSLSLFSSSSFVVCFLTVELSFNKMMSH